MTNQLTTMIVNFGLLDALKRPFISRAHNNFGLKILFIMGHFFANNVSQKNQTTTINYLL